MSTPTRTLRQGLPRIPGGEPWPPAGFPAAASEELPGNSSQLDTAQPPACADAVDNPVAQAPASPTPVEPAVPAAPLVPTVPAPAVGGALRRGLPRVPGAEPWPPAGTSIASAGTVEAAALPAQAAPAADPEAIPSVGTVATATPAPAVQASADQAAETASAGNLRRGLPRVPGGQPWPPASAAPAHAAPAASVAKSTSPIQPAAPAEQESAAPAAQTKPAAATPSAPAPQPEAPEPKAKPAQPAAVAASVAEPAPAKPTAAPQPRQPLAPATAPARPAAAAAAAPKKSEPKRHGPLTTRQWVLAGVLGAFCALGMATAVVLLARWFVGFDAISSFIARYPGEYHLPESAPVGIPGWLAWNHFFNLFLMILIIRTGLQVRHQRKPPAYWSSKRSPKVSINLWLHQSLDLLWLVNGLVFVVLLFASGHWMRIIPTSWEVFPHAISAALQYMTLDWPTENGWVNYNALQQLAYFATVFIAAPLAAATGFRLSAFWPKSATALTKRYPIEVARALHFPTMLYFALFIVVHVALVLSTGALRNLNHMFAAQGSSDPAEFADNWTGLWLFAVAILATAAAWAACRPMILASIARLFGKVSAR
ncbi:cytochrome b/b6 domain-containing protein [Glutamicibacter protophormiae]|uniref:Thiosulfate reductase cytochrome b subunit n=1 Tax=Glutamicibacter protophormiae TaxID=37930 RepID=A0ABS4XMP8_GLUPR|nr:cytochrome b/b6 domain-containing protein [Glutamicibacter protophormiae]MBP2397769.1 thiosulfate reductase cytochrome b subunit [Glutamicibacter protophormiae]